MAAEESALSPSHDNDGDNDGNNDSSGGGGGGQAASSSMLSWSTAGGRRWAAGSSVIIIHCPFKAMNQRSIVRSVESREYFFTYLNYYHTLTLKKYARTFDSRDFWHTFSCRPTLFHSFTLYDFHKGEVGIEKKVRQAGVLFGNFWEFWRTKGDGSTATGKSMPVHMLQAYHDMCNHVTLKKTKCVTFL